MRYVGAKFASAAKSTRAFILAPSTPDLAHTGGDVVGEFPLQMAPWVDG
jgi:hypothetical protein